MQSEKDSVVMGWLLSVMLRTFPLVRGLSERFFLNTFTLSVHFSVHLGGLTCDVNETRSLVYVLLWTVNGR